MPHLSLIFDAESIGPHLAKAIEHGLIDTLRSRQDPYQRHDTKDDNEQRQCRA
jgi:hypothetical protein